MDGRREAARSLLRSLLRRLGSLEAHPAWGRAGRASPDLQASFAELRESARLALGSLLGPDRVTNDELSRTLEAAEWSLRAADRMLARLERDRSPDPPCDGPLLG